MRVLNKMIQGFPFELINEISPVAAKYVRPIVKLPMISILTTCGIAVGINLACFTFIGELLQSGTFTDAPTLIVFLLVMGILMSLVLLFVTNFVMALYD